MLATRYIKEYIGLHIMLLNDRHCRSDVTAKNRDLISTRSTHEMEPLTAYQTVETPTDVMPSGRVNPHLTHYRKYTIPELGYVRNYTSDYLSNHTQRL